MASNLEDDLTCPVCINIFKDPVILSCSHSVCKACLQQFCENKEVIECPVCKRKSSKGLIPPNLALRNLCETFLQERGQKDLCQKHKRKLELFCREDQQLVCLVCRDSKLHEGHKFIPADEAATERKDPATVSARDANRFSRDLASLTQDLQKTLLLKGRSPPCYRLLTNRQYLDGGDWTSNNEGTPPDAKIRRWRFGKVDRGKKNKTILMVGETGTGKTTLINSMVTHILGVKSDNKMWFEITEEENKSQARSQTRGVTTYEVYTDDNPTYYTIIDTPGYGDPEGRKEDKKIPEYLAKLFTSYEGVQRINAIGLVVKASQNRLTESQQYIFDAVVSLFGHNVKKNIVIFITHSDGTVPENALNAIKEARIPCATDTDGQPVYFTFNNIRAQHTSKLLTLYDAYWSAREESMEEFLMFLDNMEETSLRMTEDVIKNRVALEACIINLQQRVVTMQEEQKKLEQIQAAVLANKEKLDKNENFEFEVDEVKRELKPIKEVFKGCEEWATHCSNCKENCHFPGCTWVVKNSLWLCSVMKNRQCTICSKHCSYKDHIKDEYMYINVTQKKRKTAPNLRKEYQEAYGKNVDMKARIEEKLSQLKSNQAELVNEAYENIMKLQEIALKKDDKSVIVHLGFLIDKLKKCGKDKEARDLEEIQRSAPPVSTGVKAFYESLVSLVQRT